MLLKRLERGERTPRASGKRDYLAKCVDEYLTLYRGLCPARAAVQVAVRD